ncbi:hypothetical protein EVAR_30861_1 [Eumeta japonica]|uniref:Uncharacterized protein n=1 Tax=Eumeta variegata TaxID=151549 RepID=A0A4C1XPP6_EUMVA|nr:hypothetical protein EVAR_30861_1 [Eumeta japonica]
MYYMWYDGIAASVNADVRHHRPAPAGGDDEQSNRFRSTSQRSHGQRATKTRLSRSSAVYVKPRRAEWSRKGTTCFEIV